MIRTILHQLWNQRRQNGWIFLELLIVSFFLWTVIDPIYVLTANRAIDRGYNPEGLYVVNIDMYDATNGNFNPDMASDSMNLVAYSRIARIVRKQPEVECWTISGNQSFPNSNSWIGIQVFADTTSLHKNEGFVHAQKYSFVATEGSDMLQTYEIKDAHTGKDLRLPEQTDGKAFISERLAKRLFESTDVIGKKIYQEDETLEIAGVFVDFKNRDYEQPYPLIITTYSEMYGSKYMPWWYNFIIRLKPGVDESAFIQRFQQEVGPQLSIGNFYFDSLKKFSDMSEAYAMASGVTNKLRLQYALTGFALLCIFLGMVGTFWIRSNARREEIGVMRSLGASQRCIVRQFLIEAWLLLTTAFVLVIPFLLYNAYISGMYAVEMRSYFVPNPEYWQNRFVLHFSIVLIISYLILLIIALIGTYIPVVRAARTLPADALRNE